MRTNGNGMGAYFQKLARLKAANPTVASEYDSTRDQIHKLEKQAYETYFPFEWGKENKRDWNGYYAFCATNIAPLKQKLSVLWDRLHTQTIAQLWHFELGDEVFLKPDPEKMVFTVQSRFMGIDGETYGLIENSPMMLFVPWYAIEHLFELDDCRLQRQEELKLRHGVG
jgi:hypothetical protein